MEGTAIINTFALALNSSIVSQLSSLLYTIPVILIAMTVHEVCHGYAAYKLGDPTAKSMGRLTLNPLKHLDPIGTLCMILFHFGWAKPVPINARYFKNKKRDMALTALAGPASNVVMSFIGILLYHIFLTIFVHTGYNTTFGYNVQYSVLTLIYYFYYLNLTFGIFNLIPVPPLDGSRILLIFLPQKYYFGLMKYERYIQLALMICLYLGLLTTPLTFVITKIMNGMEWLIGLIPFLA